MANIAKGRLSELDAFRGIAAFAVVLFHFTFGYDNGYNELSPGKFYFMYGYLGVNLFFMISGFVIFMTLEKTKDTKSFIISRFSRLYPVYWTSIILTIVLTTLLAAPIQKDMYTVKQVIVNFTMLQHWFKIKDVDGAYWTLAVELTFYFWMWFIFKIKKLKYTNWIGMGWIMLSLIIISFNVPFKKFLNIIFIVQYSPLFVAGILFYQLKKGGNGLLLHLLISISLLAEFYILYHVQSAPYPLAPSNLIPYAAILIFYITFYLFARNRLTVISNKILLFLGGISYSLYLIHENIGFAIIYWLKHILNKQVFYIPVTIAIVILLAYLINKYIEKPAMKKIREYYKKNEPVSITAVPLQEIS